VADGSFVLRCLIALCVAASKYSRLCFQEQLSAHFPSFAEATLRYSLMFTGKNNYYNVFCQLSSLGKEFLFLVCTAVGRFCCGTPRVISA
jgi:hypothetical protein